MFPHWRRLILPGGGKNLNQCHHLQRRCSYLPWELRGTHTWRDQPGRAPLKLGRAPLKSSRWQQRGARLLATRARLLATGPERTILAAAAAAASAHAAAAHARAMAQRRLVCQVSNLCIRWNMLLLVDICQGINPTRALALFGESVKGNNVEWGWDKHKLPLCMCGIGAGTCKSGLLCTWDTQKWTFVYVWC